MAILFLLATKLFLLLLLLPSSQYQALKFYRRGNDHQTAHHVKHSTTWILLRVRHDTCDDGASHLHGQRRIQATYTNECYSSFPLITPGWSGSEATATASSSFSCSARVNRSQQLPTSTAY